MLSSLDTWLVEIIKKKSFIIQTIYDTYILNSTQYIKYRQ